MRRKNIKIGDISVIVLVTLIAVVILLVQSHLSQYAVDNKKSVKLAYGGSEYYYPINEDKILEIHNNGIYLTVVIENSAVYISESKCKDGICVSMGKIDKPNQFIVCVPAGLIIEIYSDDSVYADEIAG